ncbi:MAG TPA: DUF1016 N-terminal domain-containing protein [Terriglobia bacterium]|nr:DUF1016 N-terminal domain-containing protein [Terriglobia bacterium]
MSALSAQLEQEFGRGFGEKNLRRMIQFAEAYPDREKCRITGTTILFGHRLNGSDCSKRDLRVLVAPSYYFLPISWPHELTPFRARAA